MKCDLSFIQGNFVFGFTRNCTEELEKICKEADLDLLGVRIEVYRRNVGVEISSATFIPRNSSFTTGYERNSKSYSIRLYKNGTIEFIPPQRIAKKPKHADSAVYDFVNHYTRALGVLAKYGIVKF